MSEPKLYYSAVETEFGFRARIYKYDASGNKEITVWQSENNSMLEEEAIDCACDYADDNNLEVDPG